LELNAQAQGGSVTSWYRDSDDSTRGPSSLALIGDGEINRTITFRGTMTSPFGELEIHGGVAKQATSDALTFDRLRWADGFEQDNTAVGAGATERLFGGRLVVSTDVAWSSGSQLWRDPSAPASLEAASHNGMARWHKIEAKLFDTPDFKWSL